MTVTRILVPYNFSEHDQKALQFVASTFSGRQDVEITLFHAFTSLPKLASDKKTVMERIDASMRYLRQKISEQEMELKKIGEQLAENAFSDKSVKTTFRERRKDLADEIVSEVKSGAYDTVVLNHKPGRISRFFTGNVFYKVVTSLTNTNVCVIS